jgi:hypothetical protein
MCPGGSGRNEGTVRYILVGSPAGSLLKEQKNAETMQTDLIGFHGESPVLFGNARSCHMARPAANRRVAKDGIWQ